MGRLLVIEIRRLIRRAARRLLLIDVLERLAITLAAAVGLLIATLIAHRVFTLPISGASDWLRLAAAAIALAVITAILWAWFRRPGEAGVARELDARADLRESLSTALAVERTDDPWARAVEESARLRAASVDVRRCVPIRAPRYWPIAPSAALALAVLWFSVPSLDVLGKDRRRVAQEQQQAEILRARQEVRAADEAVAELLRRAGLEQGSGSEGEQADAQKPLSADEIRRAAIARLTTAQDRLAELRSGERAQALAQTRQQMRQLRQGGPGPMEQMARALQQGNFAAAAEELRKLQEQIASGSLSPEDRQAMQRQAEQLARQLERLAQQREQAEQRLREAGLTPEQAREATRSLEALARATEQLQNLSPEQRQALRQQVSAMCQSAGACESMSAALDQLASAAGQPGEQGTRDSMSAMSQLGEQLSALEMLSEEMAALDAAAQEASSRLAALAGQCQGSDQGIGQGDRPGDMAGASPWSQGQTDAQGAGSGRAGNSTGGPGGDDNNAPSAIAQRAKSPTRSTGGPIIASRLVYGDQVRGESVAEFSTAVRSASQSAARALEANQVPRELQGAVKHYFGRWEERARQVQPGGAPPAAGSPGQGR